MPTIKQIMREINQRKEDKHQLKYGVRCKSTPSANNDQIDSRDIVLYLSDQELELDIGALLKSILLRRGIL